MSASERLRAGYTVLWEVQDAIKENLWRRLLDTLSPQRLRRVDDLVVIQVRDPVYENVSNGVCALVYEHTYDRITKANWR